MDLTVILCTYNRCAGLREALSSLACQEVDPALQWEVLLVDNNSSDGTAAVYQQMKQEFPAPLRYVFESQQGLSHARNRGIVEASGKYVAFTEDDEQADKGWVQAVCETFQQHGCDAVAGKIELLWRAPKPQWVTTDLLGFLGYLDYGEAQPLTREKPPFGGNMAFAKAVFEKIGGGFDTQLGRQGRKLLGGEEIELFDRFLQSHFVAVYQPRAVMHHVVEKNRLKKSYFRKLHFNEGQVRGERSAVSGKKIAGIPLFLLPQLYRSIISFLSAASSRGSNESLRKEMTVWYFLGFMLGCFRQSRQRPIPVFGCQP